MNNVSTPGGGNKLREISFSEQIAIEIKRGRKWLHLTQKELAEISGTSQTVIHRLESGKSNATIELVDRILHAMGRRAHLNVLPIFTAKKKPLPHAR